MEGLSEEQKEILDKSTKKYFKEKDRSRLYGLLWKVPIYLIGGLGGLSIIAVYIYLIAYVIPKKLIVFPWWTILTVGLVVILSTCGFFVILFDGLSKEISKMMCQRILSMLSFSLSMLCFGCLYLSLGHSTLLNSFLPILILSIIFYFSAKKGLEKFTNNIV